MSFLLLETQENKEHDIAMYGDIDELTDSKYFVLLPAVFYGTIYSIFVSHM